MKNNKIKIMSKVLCRHCSLSCKKIGLVNCSLYNAKANRPEQFKAEIKLAYANNDQNKANALQKELYQFYYGNDKN